jgi:energy-coupling factor transporter ATP-binding protein EcfA2
MHQRTDMKRIHSITLKNFKAFQDADPIVLDNRNLLLYGANGSGKSSIFWALYTFLHSSEKTTDQVAKYFDRTKRENLVNVHVPADPASIMLTLKDETTGAVTDTLQIAADKHETTTEDIKKACKSSDFVTYRVLFRFFQFSNSEEIDLWPVFEREILPYCHTVSLSNMDAAWQEIKIYNPLDEAKKNKARGLAASAIYNKYDLKVKAVSDALLQVLDTVSKAGQKFYDDHFGNQGGPKLKFTLRLDHKPNYDRKEHALDTPQIGITVTYDAKPIPRPQSFLNEALLTQMAISIRFGATKALLQDSPIKLMVLDDLLISLDMGNRMEVIDIILREPDFANYQKIIMTHDRGFFQEIRRHIGSDQHNWRFLKITGNPTEGSLLESVKSDLENALGYLANDQLSECGNQLRKCVEANLTTFLDQAKQKKGLDHLVDCESFASLHQKLNEASGILSLDSFHQFAELLQDKFSLEQLGELTSPDDIDITKFNALPRDKKGAVIAKMYAARRDLQQSIIALLSDASRKRLTAIKLLEDVRRIKDRILNPASHAGATPLYTKEAEDAKNVIQALGSALDIALATFGPQN